MEKIKLIYGTAWKKDKTAFFVEQALEQGFRALDTACHPKHYNEAGVGDGLQKAYLKGLKREDVFLQTKFTPLPGHDLEQIPYDPQVDHKVQVRQSFAASKKNLRTQYLDSLIMHSPMETWEKTWDVWQVFEDFVEKKEVQYIGISNCYNLELFTALFEQAKIKPSFLQNRFYQETGYDKELRQFCKDKGVVYQSFWTLTANPHILKSREVMEISQGLKKTPAQVFFRYLVQEGIAPLTGTTSQRHMQEDLGVFDFELDNQSCESLSALFP